MHKNVSSFFSWLFQSVQLFSVGQHWDKKNISGSVHKWPAVLIDS